MAKRISELPVLTDPTDGSEIVPVNKGGTTFSSTLAHLLSWTNPLTTLGDLFVAGVAGVRSRLGVGTENQVLTVVSGVPAWQTPATGMTNPMTTAGDLIIGGASGSPSRLAIGSDGNILSLVSGAPAWTAAPAVVTPGGATTQVQYNNAGAFAGSANFTFNSGTNTLTVTNIAGALTGNVTGNVSGSAASITGVNPAANGGTGQSSYAIGDLLYASTTTALSKLAGVATGNSLISGGVGAAPSWGKIGLTTHVSGVLPVANGGTAFSSYAIGDLLQASATGTLAKLAAVATGNVLISGGVGAVSSWGKVGLTTHVSGVLPVANGGTGAATLTGYVKGAGTGVMTASATIPVADVAGTLPATQGGTGQASFAVGDLLYASTTTALSRLPVGANTEVLTLVGGVPTWAAPSGGGGTPGGSTTQVQYNNAGAFAGAANFTWNGAGGEEILGELVVPQLTALATANSLTLAGKVQAGNDAEFPATLYITNGTASNGGSIQFYSGSADTTSGDGGSVDIAAGNATVGNGGPVNISAGGTTNGTGGGVLLQAGQGTTNGGIAQMIGGASDANPGMAVLSAGSATGAGVTGAYARVVGGFSDLGDGGPVEVLGGFAQAAGTGGPVYLRGGGSVTGDGGMVVVHGGQANATHLGGDVRILGGSTADNVDRGNIIFGTLEIVGSVLVEWARFTRTGEYVSLRRNVDRVQQVAYAATVTIDAASGDEFHIGVLTGDIAITVSNPVEGQHLRIRYKQDATGSRALTFTSPTLDPAITPVTAANAVGWLTLRYVLSETRYEMVG